MVAPRMLGPEVRRCYEEGVGFITAVGVHHDATGTALARTLAIAKAIGGLRQGALELTPMQEAVLDLGVEQVLSPALAARERVVRRRRCSSTASRSRRSSPSWCSRARSSARTGSCGSRAVRRAVAEFHSPTSQYGQLSRVGRYDHLDCRATMRELVDDISRAGSPTSGTPSATPATRELEALRSKALAPEILAFEEDLRLKLGERAGSPLTCSDDERPH